jgi:squalene-hopene/tetraprenyl-beta-curcumene cyclase
MAHAGNEQAPGTPSETAWALLTLMAAAMVGVPAVAQSQAEDEIWKEERLVAAGFPRAFLLRFYGCARYFPLWPMARFRNLNKGNRPPVLIGMEAARR